MVETCTHVVFSLYADDVDIGCVKDSVDISIVFSE